MHRGRPPPDCCQLKRVSCRIITSHMLEYTPAADLGGGHLRGCVLPGIKAEGSLTIVHKGAAGLCCRGLFVWIILRHKRKTV